MDKHTGDIRYLPPDDNVRPNEIKIDKLPRRNCKHCHGRGYIGINRDVRSKEQGNVVLCRCVKKRWSE